MGLNKFGEATLSSFLTAIAPWEAGYEHNSFAYVAKKQEGLFVISQAAIWLSTMESKVPFRYFETENICAEHVRLTDLNLSYSECINDLCAGKIVTPHGGRFFPAPINGGWHDAHFTPVHPSALQSQHRVNVLQIKGQQQIIESGPSIVDWELRGAETPYDTVQELLSEYGLGGLFADRITLEVIAREIMGFDGDVSRIDGETATIVVRLANTLSCSDAAVGYREITPGKTNRGKIMGSQFSWKQADSFQIGAYEMKVQRAAIVHCYAMYQNIAQTHWYVSDPTTSQNPRRVMFESFDTGMAVLKEFLSRTHGKGQDARDFEVGIAWLFWMLGFDAVQFGSTARTQDFADLILMTPKGHAAIIECTTGLLRADNKLPKLVARHSNVRARLDQSNNRHIKLLPIMISNLTKMELQADLEQAERLGVGVMTREDLDQLVNLTITTTNADELFARAEKNIEALKAGSAGAEPELPLS